MRAFIAVIFVCFLQTPSKADDGGSLKSISSTLTALTRITNGISLQNCCINDKIKYKQVVSQMLKLNGSFDRRGVVKSEEIFENLHRYSDAVKNFGIVRVFGVNEMKTISDIAGALLEVRSTTSSSSLQNLMNIMDPLKLVRGSRLPFIGTPEMRNMADTMNYIMTAPDKNLTDVDVINQAQQLSETYDNFMKTFEKLNAFSTSIVPLQEFVSKRKMIEEMQVLVNAMKKYSENFEKLVGVVGELDEMKKSVSTVVSIGSIQPVIKALGDQLGNVSEVVSEAMKPSDSEKLTRGLPNGVADLDAIFKDLDNEGLRNLISEGKDLNKLKTLLNPIRKFTEDVRRLETSWRPVNDKKSLETLSELSENLKKMSKGAQGLSTDANALRNSIQSVQKCFNGIQNLPAALDFESFTKFYNFTMSIMGFSESCLKSVNEILNMKSGLNDTANTEVSVILKRFAPSTNRTAIIVKLRQSGAFRQLAGDLKKMNALLEPFQHFAEQFQQIPDIAQSHVLVNTAKNSSFVSIVKCFADSKHSDVKESMKVLNILSEIEKDAIHTTEGYLKKYSNFSQEFLKTESSNQRRRSSEYIDKVESDYTDMRTRRNVNGTTNMTEMSQKLGQGVEVLQKMSRVLSDKESVKKVAESASEVDFEIQNIPKMSGVWKKERKEELLQMIRELGDLEETAGKVDVKDLLTMQTLFEAATKIKGSQIDTRLLLDPVSLALNTSTSPTVKSAVKDFQIVGNLDIDFTNTHLDLRAASGTLSILQNYFDRFFGIKRVRNYAKTSLPAATVRGPVADFSWLVPVLILVFLLAVIMLIWIIVRIQRRSLLLRRLYMDPDSLASYTRERCRHRDFLESRLRTEKFACLLEAVKAKDVESAKYFVQNGADVDAIECGFTLLHIAIIHEDPRMVDLLIRNGADRNQVDKNGKKPREKNLENKTGKGMEIEGVFRKCESKTFSVVLPPHLPQAEYRIFVADPSLRARLGKAHPLLIAPSLSSASHVALPSDQGIVDLSRLSLDLRISLIGKRMCVTEKYVKSLLRRLPKKPSDLQFAVRQYRYYGETFTTCEPWHSSTARKSVSLFIGNRKVTIVPTKQSIPEEDAMIWAIFNDCDKTKFSVDAGETSASVVIWSGVKLSTFTTRIALLGRHYSVNQLIKELLVWRGGDNVKKT